jgi:DNA-binding transcriptional regulator YhcF (GntR family)
MERIVLEVDDTVAKAWRTASVKLKREIGTLLNKQIATIIDKKEEKDIIMFLDELRQEMAEKGLTQEILDDILKDND